VSRVAAGPVAGARRSRRLGPVTALDRSLIVGKLWSATSLVATREAVRSRHATHCPIKTVNRTRGFSQNEMCAAAVAGRTRPVEPDIAALGCSMARSKARPDLIEHSIACCKGGPMPAAMHWIILVVCAPCEPARRSQSLNRRSRERSASCCTSQASRTVGVAGPEVAFRRNRRRGSYGRAESYGGRAGQASTWMVLESSARRRAARRYRRPRMASGSEGGAPAKPSHRFVGLRQPGCVLMAMGSGRRDAYAVGI
jgi:hypothetical protein